MRVKCRCGNRISFGRAGVGGNVFCSKCGRKYRVFLDAAGRAVASVVGDDRQLERVRSVPDSSPGGVRQQRGMEAGRAGRPQRGHFAGGGRPEQRGAQRDWLRVVSFVVFAGVFFSFFLPLVTISFEDGAELRKSVFYFVVNRRQNWKTRAFLGIPLACAIAGAALSGMRARRIGAVRLAAATAGALSLLRFRFWVEPHFAESAAALRITFDRFGMLQTERVPIRISVSFGSGWWIAFLLLCGAACVSACLLARRDRER